MLMIPARKPVLTVMAAGVCLMAPTVVAKFKLPDGVTLPEGIEIPDDFELPEGINIPEGFQITEDMVIQFMKYLETQEKEGEEPDKDAWWSDYMANHPNSDLQMNMKRIDSASANEESQFKAKLEDTMMSKEVILPVIGVIVAIIAIWAFMTKCGKRSCCKKQRIPVEQVLTKKVIKSDKSETNSEANDIESGSRFSGPQSEIGSQSSNRQQKSNKVGVSKDLELV